MNNHVHIRRVLLCSLTLVAATICCGGDSGVSPTAKGAKTCGSCHALPPTSGRHEMHVKGLECNACHGCVVDDTRAFIDQARHGGAIDVCGSAASELRFDSISGSCSNIGCHGVMTWAERGARSF